jgi:hypothetical protein
MQSSAIQGRSIVESSEGSIAPSVAPSVCLEERRRDVQSIVRSIAGSVASSVANEGRKRDVRSIAYAWKHYSRSCRKSKTQYGKSLDISQFPLTARKVTLDICRRKEEQPLTALDSKQKISLSLL